MVAARVGPVVRENRAGGSTSQAATSQALSTGSPSSGRIQAASQASPPPEKGTTSGSITTST
jgi:hypothetical protein